MTRRLFWAAVVATQIGWLAGWLTLVLWLADRYRPQEAPVGWIVIFAIPVLFIPAIAGSAAYESRWGRRR